VGHHVNWAGHGIQSIAAIAVIAATGALTTGVIMGTSSLGPDNRGPAAPSANGLTLGQCGSQVTGRARTDLRLQITVAVPEGPLSANDPHPQIEMTVKNTSSSGFRISTYRSGAFLTIVKDGIVVRPPGGKRDVAIRFTLEAGATRTYLSPVNMLRCDPADNSSAAVPLEPGMYQLYAVQHFFIHGAGGEQEASLDVQGGPWDIQVVS
jgi:hypothetical protein